MTRAPVGERAAYLSPVAACLRGGGGAWLPGDGVLLVGGGVAVR